MFIFSFPPPPHHVYILFNVWFSTLPFSCFSLMFRSVNPRRCAQPRYRTAARDLSLEAKKRPKRGHPAAFRCEAPGGRRLRARRVFSLNICGLSVFILGLGLLGGYSFPSLPFLLQSPHYWVMDGWLGCVLPACESPQAGPGHQGWLAPALHPWDVAAAVSAHRLRGTCTRAPSRTSHGQCSGTFTRASQSALGRTAVLTAAWLPPVHDTRPRGRSGCPAAKGGSPPHSPSLALLPARAQLKASAKADTLFYMRGNIFLLAEET